MASRLKSAPALDGLPQGPGAYQGFFPEIQDYQIWALLVPGFVPGTMAQWWVRYSPVLEEFVYLSTHSRTTSQQETIFFPVDPE